MCIKGLEVLKNGFICSRFGRTANMLYNILVSFSLLSLLFGQDAINNGAEPPLLPSEAPSLEKRRIIGWTTRRVTYYPTRHDHDGCHDHHPPCDTRTVFVVPSTITEVRKQTIYTYQTIPVPIPVPPCPCAIPDCRQNGCSQNIPPPCGCTRANPCNSCNGGGCNNVVSTSTIPYTTPAPASSVIVLSTKTSSVTIYTQSSPPAAENAADPTSKLDFNAMILSLIAAAAILMA